MDERWQPPEPPAKGRRRRIVYVVLGTIGAILTLGFAGCAALVVVVSNSFGDLNFNWNFKTQRDHLKAIPISPAHART